MIREEELNDEIKDFIINEIGANYSYNEEEIDKLIKFIGCDKDNKAEYKKIYSLIVEYGKKLDISLSELINSLDKIINKEKSYLNLIDKFKTNLKNKEEKLNIIDEHNNEIEQRAREQVEKILNLLDKIIEIYEPIDENKFFNYKIKSLIIKEDKKTKILDEYIELNKKLSEKFVSDSDKNKLQYKIENRIEEIVNKNIGLLNDDDYHKLIEFYEDMLRYRSADEIKMLEIKLKISKYNKILNKSYEENLEDLNIKLNEKLSEIENFEKKEFEDIYLHIFNKYKTKDFPRAIHYLQEFENNLKKDDKKVASKYESLAEKYREIKNFDKALSLLDKSKTSYSEEGKQDKVKKIENLKKIIKNEEDTHIQKIEITNFKLFKDTITTTLEPNINIFIGKNSSGKTSILQALALALISKERKKRLEEESYFPSYGKYIKLGKKESSINITLKVPSITNNKEEGISRKIIITEDDIHNIEDELKIFVLGYSSNIFLNKKPDYDKLIKNLINGENKDYYISSLFNDCNSNFYNPLKVLEKLHNEINRIEKDKDSNNYATVMKLDRIGKLKNNIEDTIQNFLNEETLKFKLKEEDGKYYFQDKKLNDKFSKLDYLSEGYINHIILLTDILIRIFSNRYIKEAEEANGIILIDEFDRHLHPEWQIHLLNTLEKMFPRIQFILTTHNPMAILGRAKHQIKSLNLNEIEQTVNIKSEGDTMNTDVSTVYLTHFYLKSLVDKDFKKKIDNFYMLKEKKDYMSILEGKKKKIEEDEMFTEEDEKLLKKIGKELSKTIAVNFIYDKKYLEFLKFINWLGLENLSTNDEELFDELLSHFKDNIPDDIKAHVEENRDIFTKEFKEIMLKKLRKDIFYELREKFRDRAIPEVINEYKKYLKYL